MKNEVKFSAICFTLSHFRASHLIYKLNVKVQLSILPVLKVYPHGIEHHPQFMAEEWLLLKLLEQSKK